MIHESIHENILEYTWTFLEMNFLSNNLEFCLVTNGTGSDCPASWLIEIGSQMSLVIVS